MLGQRAYESGVSTEGRAGVSVTAATNSSPNPDLCSSYQTAASRNSARASGWSSTRTPPLELLQDLRPRRLPGNRLDSGVRDLSRSVFQLASPCGGDVLL